MNLNATNPANVANNGTGGYGTANALAPSYYSTLTLAAGTYTVRLVDTATTGAVYNSGWSYSANSAAPGGPAPNSWVELIGTSTGGFTPSSSYGQYTNTSSQYYFFNGNTYISQTAAYAAFVNSPGTFTLASTTAVTFYIADTSGSFNDNTGGVSLAIAAVAPLVANTPEPSSLMLLGTGLVGVVGAARRRLFA